VGVQVTELEGINRGEKMLEEGDREGHVPKWSLRAMEEKQEVKRKKVVIQSDMLVGFGRGKEGVDKFS
jgi:hypothetical protein